MSHRNVEIHLGYRFLPYKDYRNELDDDEKSKAREEVEKAARKMFKNRLADGPFPRARLDVDKDTGHAPESGVETCLREALKAANKAELAQSKLHLRKPKSNPDPEETTYVIIDGETYCIHPYPSQIEDNPGKKDWTVDLKKFYPGLKARFYFGVGWPTPIFDEH